MGMHMGMNDIPMAIQKLVYIVCCGVQIVDNASDQASDQASVRGRTNTTTFFWVDFDFVLFSFSVAAVASDTS